MGKLPFNLKKKNTAFLDSLRNPEIFKLTITQKTFTCTNHVQHTLQKSYEHKMKFISKSYNITSVKAYNMMENKFVFVIVLTNKKI